MTSAKIRTVVSFRSDAFNTTDPKDYFINECCFGDDVGRWLISALRSRSVDVDAEPDQEDWGWCVTCRADGNEHTLGIGFRPGDADGDAGEWLCFIERRVGLFRRLRGERTDDAAAIVPNTLHHVLSHADRVSDIRWHFKSDFDALDENQWAPEPGSASRRSES